ncbi:uncharacterized protein LOC142228791 isoform X1 [Haematobia irritans]|uniref:uncharacterized protein LOC142228791 isoform X1 n=1 Tax=Haematobia irritans TaxID=7368 RepID=UPI003F4FAC32
MVCRLCLKDDSSIASVVKLYRNSELNVIEGLEMARLVEKYLDIEVTHDDAISTIICSECHGHLKEFHKFRKNVEEKQETLQSECVQVKNEVPVSVSFVEANDDDCDRIVPDTWELEDESCDYIMEIVKTEDEKEGNDQNLFDDCQNNGKSEESNKNVFSSDVHSSGVLQAKDNDGNLLIAELLKEIRTLKWDLKERDEAQHDLIINLTDEVMALRREVKRHISTNDTEVETSNLFPSLPFYSLDDFREFDEQVLLDEEMQTQLKYIIQRLGGKDMPTFMRLAIKSVISDDLAVGLTWRGTPEKPSIQDFATFKIMKDMCHTKFKEYSVLDINRVCQQHVLHARDRVASRKRKREM